MSSIKNENTLFRFVSLRSPELPKAEGRENRFVFHATGTGAYFTAVAGRATGVSKKQAMVTASASVSHYSTETEMRSDIGTTFVSVAVSLAHIRTDPDAQKIYDLVSTVSPLTSSLQAKLWDNLIYQVLFEKDHTLKEILMQALVLQNLLIRMATYGTMELKLAHLPELANARVVLPVSLFDEGVKLGLQEEPAPDGDPKPTPAERINEAKNYLKQILNAQKTFEKVVSKFRIEKQSEYDKIAEEYKAAIKPLLIERDNIWKAAKRAACSNPLPGTPEKREPSYLDYCAEPDVDPIELPEFSFEYIENLEQTLDEISESKKEIIVNIIEKYGPATTFDEVLQVIEEAIGEQHNIIASNRQWARQILMIGGVPLSLDEPIPPAIPPITPDASTPVAGQPAFVPQKWGFSRLGIADYRKVVSHVCCYDAGEVAHIENIMASELRSKSTVRERVEENTETTEISQETESLTDTVSTERFQMQTEIAKQIQQQNEAHANASFNANWGGAGATYSLGAAAGYSTATSKEESNRQAVAQSKEITQRAMERVVTRMRQEVVRKTAERFREENVHAFDNRAGQHHISGVYRFINAVYKNQIYNYGKRLMYEFMIPQPSKLHRLAMLAATSNTAAVVLQKPVDPATQGISSAIDINEYNYLLIASKYRADVDTPPPAIQYLDFSMSKDNINPSDDQHPFIGSGGYATHSSEFKIPDGYEVESASGSYSGREIGNSTQHPQVSAVIGGRDAFNPTNSYHQVPGTAGNAINVSFTTGKPRVRLTVSLSTWDERAFTINILAKCTLTKEARITWQMKTYKAIIDAYQRMLAEYNSGREEATIRDTNPGFYRQTEQMVLRRHCISYLLPDESVLGKSFYQTAPGTGSTLALENLQVARSQNLDNYTSLAKFLEQAFEWEEISYSFYPYYWGERAEWRELYQFDCDDPLFRNFMQAGMARVVATVRPGFEDALMMYMSTGQLWLGGQVPVLGDPLYLSVVDELKNPEYVVDETWETVVPTSLVALQASGVAIDASGLPCGDGCEDGAGDGLVDNSHIMTGI